MMVRSILIGLLFATPALAQPAPAASDAGANWPVSTWHIGGEGRWDYVTIDSAHARLYVPRSTHTQVLDATSGKVIADIPGQKGNHGVAIAPDANRGFITDGRDASVTIFDLTTSAVLGTVHADDDADGAIYDPASKKILVSCGDAAKLILIPADADPKTAKADAVDLGGKPEFLAADGKGKAYVNLVDKDQIAVVDTINMKLLDKWPVAPGGQPVGMAIDAEHGRLFVGCRKPQKLIVMNTADGKVLADLPIGPGVDATGFDDVSGNAFASCRDGTLSVARETSPGKFEIVQTVKTRAGARTMCVDPKTHAVYLPTAEFEPTTRPQGRPAAKPDSFMIVVVQPKS